MTPTLTDENDNNNNVDEGFENDNISVTGSPSIQNSIHEDDDKRSSPSPPPTGAFTSLIQRNNVLSSPNSHPPTHPSLPPAGGGGAFKKSEFLSGFASANIPQPNQQQHAFNHALAAQLFLQSPLIPQPSQWLYTQLYSNYNDMPWFRNTLQNSPFRAVAAATGPPSDVGPPAKHDLVKRAVKLISHDDIENEQSPPVSSTRRSPSPTDDDVEKDVEVVTCKNSDISLGPIRSRTPKHVDVWRPY